MGKNLKNRKGLCAESGLYESLHAIYRSERECTREQFHRCCEAAAKSEYEEVCYAVSLLRGARSAGLICVGVSTLLIGFLSYCAGIVFRLRPVVCLICMILLAAVIVIFLKNSQECMEYEYLLNILEEERERRR